MKVAITTPTGKVGSKLVDKLLSDGKHDIVLMARKPERLADAKSRGAEIRQGDQTDKEYVREATKDVDVLFWVNPPNPNVQDINKYYGSLAENAAAAVKANDIPRVIFLSSIGAHLKDGVGPVNGFYNAEKTLREACDNLVIMRPTYFMENFLGTVPTVKESKSIYFPVEGDTTFPVIATQDIANAAYDIINESFTGVEIRPLHGPKDYRFADLADILSRELNDRINYVRVPEEQFKDALLRMGMSDYMADLMVEMHEAIDKKYMKSEQPRDDSSTTETSLEDFVKNIYIPALKS